MKINVKTLTTFALVFFVSTPVLATENLFYYFENTYGFESLKENYKDIDIFAPQTYEVDFAYDVLKPSKIDQEVLDFAKRKRNMDIMPLVHNTGFNKYFMINFLDDEDAQEKVIDQLIDIADDEEYEGWQYDFENIPYTHREEYTDFVKKSARAFKKERLKFSVAVVPRDSDHDDRPLYANWSSGYEFAKIAEEVDFMTLMSYDDPMTTGPVASLDYVNRVLDYMIEDQNIDPEKLSLGVPAYCWQWEFGAASKDRSYIYSRIVEKYEESSPFNIRIYLEDVGAEAFFYFDKLTGKPYLTWCDSYKSFEEKQEIVDDRDLHGMSVWALGQEDERIWDNL